MRTVFASRPALLALSALLAAGLGASPTRLAAQQAPRDRFSFGAHLQLSEPRGDFANNTNTGFGLGGYMLIRGDENAILNFRTDLSFVNYANSRRRVPLTGTGGLIQLDLNTNSSIVSVLAGPQLLGPTGRFTPYATALGGFSVFTTVSAVEGSNNDAEPFASSTNQNDAVWAYGGAAGAYLKVHSGRAPVRIDLGARFLRHDDVRYLNDQRIKEAFDNDRPPVPVRGRADFLTYYAGVNIIAF
jgi:hypothetical protein